MLSARSAFGPKAEGLVRELRWGQIFSVVSCCEGAVAIEG